MSAAWQPTTLEAMWRSAVGHDPGALFLRFADDDCTTATWTYGEFDQVVKGAARRFQDAGIGAGDAVHLALANSPSFVAAWLAAIHLGAWVVPSDPYSTPRELAVHLARTRPQVGLAATGRLADYRAAADVITDVLPPTVIDVDEADSTLPWLAPLAAVRTAPARPQPLHRAAVLFTSGTTGAPKGVEVTQANYAFSGSTMAAACDLTADDRQLVVLPLFHANAQYYSFAAAIAVGASVALMSRFSASRFVDQAGDHEATCASLFAGPIRMVLARGAARHPDRSPLRLRHCWYAQNLTQPQYDTISAWLGCRPRQLYGMTETIPAVLTDEREHPRCDSMGRVTPGCAVELRDGEVVVGGEPGVTLFAGYLDDSVATEAAFVDGWFRTGDRAVREADGRYRFAGRRSDVIKVAGENVSLVEVEAVLADHPGVADVAVVGVPDPVRDEVPLAVVVPADHDGDHGELRRSLERWCAERLGKAKRPHDVRIVDELPRTSVGKIKKYVLKEAP